MSSGKIYSELSAIYFAKKSHKDPHLLSTTLKLTIALGYDTFLLLVFHR